MPAKKKAVKSTKEDIKPMSDQTVANSTAIGDLTQIADSHHTRMAILERKMEEIMHKLGQVLTRLGL